MVRDDVVTWPTLSSLTVSQDDKTFGIFFFSKRKCKCSVYIPVQFIKKIILTQYVCTS